MQLAEELEFGLKQYQKQQGGDALEHQLQRLTFTKTTPHPATVHLLFQFLFSCSPLVMGPW